MDILELYTEDGRRASLISSKYGGEWLGECPLCGRDSFYIYPEKSNGYGRYWCRNCGASGDMSQYLRDVRRWDFNEATEILGRRPPHDLAQQAPDPPDDAGADHGGDHVALELGHESENQPRGDHDDADHPDDLQKPVK